MLVSRDRDVFCLNDAPDPAPNPIPARDVVAFLEAYYPLPSGFEKSWDCP
jgi:hypothetical protein